MITAVHNETNKEEKEVEEITRNLKLWSVYFFLSFTHTHTHTHSFSLSLSSLLLLLLLMFFFIKCNRMFQAAVANKLFSQEPKQQQQKMEMKEKKTKQKSILKRDGERKRKKSGNKKERFLKAELSGCVKWGYFWSFFPLAAPQKFLLIPRNHTLGQEQSTAGSQMSYRTTCKHISFLFRFPRFVSLILPPPFSLSLCLSSTHLIVCRNFLYLILAASFYDSRDRDKPRCSSGLRFKTQ